jgi:hypothetical protein
MSNSIGVFRSGTEILSTTAYYYHRDKLSSTAKKYFREFPICRMSQTGKPDGQIVSLHPPPKKPRRRRSLRGLLGGLKPVIQAGDSGR